MPYIGNTNTTQAFTPAVDFFNGNGSTTAFTLSRPVASVAQVQAVIENVPQNPGDAFTVSGNTITFTSAPPSGTSNIYVYYTSPITQVIAPSQGTVGTSALADNSVTTAKIAAGAVVTEDLANSAVTVAKINATGTPSSSTYLRGDGAWAAGGYSGPNGQVFTSSGTFTIPSGVTSLKVTVVAGGGSGASGSASTTGAGGGAGGTAIKYLTGLTAGNTLTVTRGAAGAASSVASGTQSITTISATAGSAGSSGSGGAGGVGSGGDLNISGGGGAGGVRGDGTGSAGGQGGASVFGAGGASSQNAAGSASGNYGGGGGGGGAYYNNCSGWIGLSGAAGAGGVVVFEW